MLNLPPPTTAHGKCTALLAESIETVAKSSMAAAAEGAVELRLNDPNTDLPITFAGHWQTRDFKSKNGYSTIIITSLGTRKILDTEVLNRFCSGFTEIKPKGHVKNSSRKEFCQELWRS